jgi:hypothetical protein
MESDRWTASAFHQVGGPQAHDSSGPAATFYATVTLSFVIPSKAEGSAVSSDLSWKCFSTERRVVGGLTGSFSWLESAMG